MPTNEKFEVFVVQLLNLFRRVKFEIFEKSGKVDQKIISDICGSVRFFSEILLRNV